MDTGLYHAVAAMRAGEKRLESIAHNLANVSTHGYKREQSFAHALAVGRSKNPQVVAGAASDPSQGVLETTGNPLDLALEGKGFFVVETPSGRAYARDGSFRLDNDGALVTQDGFRVAWKNGRGTLRVADEMAVVDADGKVRQGENSIGQIDIVDVDDPARLVPTADGRWSAPPGVREIPSKASVRQSSLERSNVEAMDELVALVMVQRSFENAASTLKAIEQSYRRLNQPR